MRIEGEELGSLENLELAAPEPWVRGWRHEDRQYVRCRFHSVKLLEPGTMLGTRSFPAELTDRPVLRRVGFERCTFDYRTWDARAAVLDEVTISHLKAELHLELCALRHVTLDGRLGQVRINWSSGTYAAAAEEGFANMAHRARVDEQNDRFHADVDWMLDLRGAISRDWCLRGLPPEKVRIDASRMAFVSKASLEPARALLEGRELKGLCGSVVRSTLTGREASPATFCWVTPRGPEQEAELELIALLLAEGLTLPTAPLPEPEP